MAAVKATQITKTFDGHPALRGVSIEVGDGEFCCMLGASGSGKTTLLRSIAGLTEPDDGTILIGDRDVTRLSSEKRRIGFVFQHYALFPHLTISANVAFGLRAQGIARGEARARAREMLDLVGLGGYARRRPKELSGGQQQRVALARALVTGPDVLLLDEPLSALDTRIRHEMQQELKRLHGETKVTTIMVTHDHEEAMDLGDQVLLLDDGTVQQAGRPELFYRDPANLLVAEFLGAVPLGRGMVHGTGTSRTVEIGGNQLAVDNVDLDDAAVVSVAVRPEYVTIEPVSPPGGGGGSQYRGHIEGLEFFGAFARAIVRCGDLKIPSLMLAHNAMRLEAGLEVRLEIGEEGLYLFPDGGVAPTTADDAGEDMQPVAGGDGVS